ncbi:uncharacterized protein SEPMUDRAFT_152393 [Sphaerulina musiva SO2202]|uniref:Uncharacterized protein n=1 Tax=Sphaerulina musiva (strain SO2202) TaxID=692275 RepID=M3CWR0_SPHMS|nr:uncharacterized protein SEPMUDRAFT_152393 [Sphaerulina musiva SO2202]EMF08111.1 hypothetical protein SEPMUDRAFT_152393 [Sphaerulina musiva SO2202]
MPCSLLDPSGKLIELTRRYLINPHTNPSNQHSYTYSAAGRGQILLRPHRRSRTSASRVPRSPPHACRLQRDDPLSHGEPLLALGHLQLRLRHGTICQTRASCIWQLVLRFLRMIDCIWSISYNPEWRTESELGTLI